MANTTRIGTGCTIATTTTHYAAEILSVSQGDESVPIIDTSHMGTTGSRTKIAGTLIDHGSVDVEIHIPGDDLDTMKTLLGATRTYTITFPTVSGEAGGAKASGSGTMSSHNYSLPLEDKWVGGYTISWLGAVTYTDST